MKTRIGTAFHTWRRSRKTRDVLNVRVGKADVRVDAPSHVWGVIEGNHRGHREHERGIHPRRGLRSTATARRSTGINPLARNSIVPGAPRLTPP